MKKSSRWVFFSIAIAIGLMAGLLLGWLIAPPRERENAGLDDLRADYKTDLVLMVAETYATRQDKLAALDSLAAIDNDDPLTLMVNSITYGEGIGLPAEESARIRQLFNALDMTTIEAWREGRNGN